MVYRYPLESTHRIVSPPPARTLPVRTNDMYKDFYGGYRDGAVGADNDYSSVEMYMLSNHTGLVQRTENHWQ